MSKSNTPICRTRAEIFNLIKKSIKSEAKSTNAIAKETGLEWKTVQNAIILLSDLGLLKKSTTQIKGRETILFKLKKT